MKNQKQKQNQKKKSLNEDVFDRPRNRIFLEGYDKDGKITLVESQMVAKRSMLGESSKYFLKLHGDGSIVNKGQSTETYPHWVEVEVDSSVFLSYASYLRTGKESSRTEVLKGLNPNG